MSSAPGIAIPGSSVPASSAVAPGGAQGIQGIQGAKGPPPYTVTTADFTMPAPGSTVIVNVQDASWIIVGEMLTVQTAGGNPTTAASLRCTAKSGNQLTLLYQPPTTIPLATTTQAGLLGPISGNSTDYVGGDNIPHPWPPLPMFYGADTTNNAAYAVTVASSFALVPGVVVHVTPSVTNVGASPTLNVNGTGAKTICTRTGVALQGANELGVGRTFGVVYDGTNWRLITPIRRQYTLTASSGPVNPTIECSGYDGVDAYLIQGAGGATTYYIAATFAHCGPGFQINIQLWNNQSVASSYSLAFTNDGGATLGGRWIWSSVNAAGTAGINLNGSISIGASSGVNPVGFVSYGGGAVFGNV